MIDKNKKNSLFEFLLMGIVISIAYGLTLGMYFFQDDSALIFKLQHPEGAAGFFGSGLFQRGVYQYVVVPFVPFFKIFGLNPFGYYLIGFLLFSLSVFFFYLFVKELIPKNKLSYFATLIYASGYLGSDSAFRVINYWSANIGIILTLISLWQFTKYLKNKSVVSYLWGLAFFLAATELAYYRSHSIVFLILFLDILITLFPFRIKELPRFILRQLPFLLIFKSYYLIAKSPGSLVVTSFFKDISAGKIEKLSSLFANLGNVLIPDQVQSRVLSLFVSKFSFETSSLMVFLSVLLLTILLFKLLRLRTKKTVLISFLLFGATLLNIYFYQQNLFWYKDIQTVVAGYLGMSSIIVVFFLAYHFWRDKRNVAVSLLLGEVFILSQIFGYYIKDSYAIYGTIHRYFSYSTIGYSLVAGALCLLIFEKLPKYKFLKLSPIIVVVLIHLILGFNLQTKILKERSIPNDRFNQDLKRFVPVASKGDIFYFDVADDNLSRRQLYDFFSVGSMPATTAIAIHYGIDRDDISIFTEYDELLYYLSKNKTDLDKVHTFFYSPNGLIDTTSQTRNLLLSGSNYGDINNLEKFSFNSFVPILVNMQMRASLADKPDKLAPSSALKTLNYSLDQKITLFNYLRSRKRYYDLVKISSETEWKYRETRNAVDRNFESPWQGNRSWWFENDHEELRADLGERRSVGAVLWQNWKDSLSPVSYNIQTSLDGRLWQKVYEVTDSLQKKDGQIVLNSFNPVEARYIKMEITKTIGDDSPAIAEFEVVNSEFKNLDLAFASAIEENPFSIVETDAEWDVLKTYIKEFTRLVISWSTDKGNNRMLLPIYADSLLHTYEFVIPAGGTELSSLSFTSNTPLEIRFYKTRMKNLSFDEIKRRGLIKEFREN